MLTKNNKCYRFAFLLTCLVLANDAFVESTKPNFIFMIADDLNDSIGVMAGHPQTKTPNIDELASRGVMFRNAQVNSPICGPSRASLLTGLAPHTTGYYGYNFIEDHWRDNPSLKHAVTIPEHFRSAGYKILITGKIYHNNQEDVSLWYTQGIPPDWGPWPWDGSRDDGYEHGTLSPWRNSLPHPSMPEGYGIDNSYASLRDVPNVAPDADKGIPGYKGWRLFFEPFKYNNPKDRDLMPDELNTKWVKEQLKQQHEKPFFMLVGFNRPHTPMYVPQKYLDRFPIKNLTLPKVKTDDLNDVAKGLKRDDISLSTQGYGYFKYDQLTEHGDEKLREWVQAYLASVNFVDEQVGKIVEALNKSDYANNTYVVFTSDHGYHLGEKEMVFKNTPWEESARVPLIVYGPSVDKGKTLAQPVSLIDLFPTFIDLADIPEHPNRKTNQIALSGYSMAPLLNGKPWLGPNVALTSVAGKDQLSMREPGKIEKQYHSIRSEHFRYILTPNGGEELYDHRADPNEWTNLANEKNYQTIKAKLKMELAKLLGVTL